MEGEEGLKEEVEEIMWVFPSGRKTGKTVQADQASRRAGE